MGFRGSLIRRALLLGTLVAALLTSLAAGSGSAAGDPDLVGEWHLDQIDGVAGTTPDSSGNGLTGRSVIATTTPGRFGNAFQFTNTGDGVDVPDDPALKPNRMTVMAWVKENGNPLQYRTIVGKGADGCSSRAYLLDVGSLPGHLRFAVNLVKPNGDSFVTSFVQTESANPGIWDGQWHAIAGTYDGATARLYVDGAEVGSAPVPAGYTDVYYSSASTNDPRLSIGRYVQPGGGCDQSGFQYRGAIDEVRIYKRALSATEINYLQTAAGTTPPELPPPTTTTTTTTTSPGGGPVRPVAHFLIGKSSKLKGAVRLSGLSSAAAIGRRIDDYQWRSPVPPARWMTTAGRAR